MKKYLFLTLIITGVTSVHAGAQPREQYYTLDWNGGMALAGFRHYTTAPGWNGGTVRAHLFFTDHLALGFSCGWSTYYEETARMAYQISPAAVVTAEQQHYAHLLPMEVSANYFFRRRTTVDTYFGVGIGGAYTTLHAAISDWDFWYAQWGFQLSPELGAFIHLSERYALHVAAAYHISAQAFTFGEHRIDDIQRLTLSVGITCKLAD